MKIVDLECRIVTMPLNKSFINANAEMSNVENKDFSFIFTKLTTD